MGIHIKITHLKALLGRAIPTNILHLGYRAIKRQQD